MMKRFIAILLLISGLIWSLPALAQPDAVLERYYGLRDADPVAARDILVGGVSRYPDDVRLNLEYAYLLLEEEAYQEAATALRRVLAVDSGRADVWKQLGYTEKRQGNGGAALSAFIQARKYTPEDEALTLEIAWLRQRNGDYEEAEDGFRRVSLSIDPSRVNAACAGIADLAGRPAQGLAHPWFAEIYAAPEYRSKLDVAVLPVEARIGISGGDSVTWDLYASLRAARDNRTGLVGEAPAVLFDNAAVLAAGARLQPIAGFPLALFAEAGWAWDLVDQGGDSSEADFRGGFFLHQEWNILPDCPEGPNAPHFVADLYADAVYYSRYDDNLLYMLRARPGIRLLEGTAWGVDAYALLAGYGDVQGETFNRFAEAGGGFVLHGFGAGRLALRGEALRLFSDGNGSEPDFRARLEYSVSF